MMKLEQTPLPIEQIENPIVFEITKKIKKQKTKTNKKKIKTNI